MERIKTNIIELNKLYEKPCEEWLKRFQDGKIDAHKAFKKYVCQYDWLYKNSPYDLVGWEIENNCFNWKKYSWVVAKYCPSMFDTEKFNWKEDSWAVAKYCHNMLDPKKYNWKRYSWLVAKYCSDKIDPKKYNWTKDSWAIAEYCPDKLKLKPRNKRKLK